MTSLPIDVLARVFVAQFAVMNVTPVLPLLLSHARRSPQESGTLLRTALVTAVGAGVALVLIGPAVLGALGIEAPDMRVAGGVILLVFATHDLLFSRQSRQSEPETRSDLDLGIVPLGVPILFGPSGMVALLVLAELYGVWLALGIFLVNQLINAVLLALGHRVVHHLGAAATVAGKLMALVLAALAVSMLRIGLGEMMIQS